MKTAAELTNMVGVTSNDGCYWAYKLDAQGKAIGPPDAFPELVLHKNAVNPEFFNLLSASILLYKANEHALEMFDRLSEMFEKEGIEILIDSLNQISASLQVARRAALEGFANVIKTPN